MKPALISNGRLTEFLEMNLDSCFDLGRNRSLIKVRFLVMDAILGVFQPVIDLL